MPPHRLPLRALLLSLAAATGHAQTTPHKPHSKAQSSLNPNVVVLDAAHGGSDNGAKLGADSVEKDATIAFAARLKTVLTAHGFTVILTHESANDQLSSDQRAELANHSRAVACLLLHAATGGHGVHLLTSGLPATNFLTDTPRPVLPWNSAQSASLDLSLKLSADLSDALYGIRVPLVAAKASVPPIDSLTCPAVAIELAPLAPDAGADPDTAPTPPTDAGYQQRIADAIATALDNWRGKVVAQNEAEGNAAEPTRPAPKPTPKPAPKAKPIPIPEEKPDIIPPTPKPPAGGGK